MKENMFPVTKKYEQFDVYPYTEGYGDKKYKIYREKLKIEYQKLKNDKPVDSEYNLILKNREKIICEIESKKTEDIKLSKNDNKLFGVAKNSSRLRIMFFGIKMTFTCEQLAWWIPVRKWRNSFREYFKNN